MEKAQDLMFSLETEILNKINYYLTKGDIDTYSAQWQLDKLKELGSLNSDVEKLIREYKPPVNTATEEEIQQASDNTFKELRQALPADRTIEMTPQLQITLDMWIQSAESDVNISMARLAQNAGQQYVTSLNKASLQVIIGQSTLRTAIKSAVIETTNNGLPAYRDKANRLWTPEAYTQMVIRSNQRRVATATMFDSARQLGTDIIEVSSHIGARPKCAPYQGRLFSISGTSSKYDSLYNDTSFGQADGLDGINCGHIFYPFVDGMRQTYKPYPVKDNEKTYAESQQQRKYERDIRKYKRNEKLYKKTYEETGDIAYKNKADYYKGRTRETQKELRGFINETGRTRRSDREQIYS